MIRVVSVRRINGDVDEYRLFGDETAFLEYQAQTGVKLASWGTCQPGDYVKTDNGWFIPVYKIVEQVITPNIAKKIGKVRRIAKVYCPRFERRLRMDADNNLMGRYRLFYNPDTPSVYRHNAKLDARDYAIMTMLQEGFDFVAAFKYIYKEHAEKRIMSLLRVFIQDPRKRNQLTEVIMSSLKNELEQEGLTKQFIARELKNLLRDKSEDPMLRKIALQTVLDVHTKEDKMIKSPQGLLGNLQAHQLQNNNVEEEPSH